MNPHTIPTPPPPTPDWREAAACVEEDPDLFYPATSNGADGAWVIPRRICSGCPVKAECVDDVMAREGISTSSMYRYGMWGGLTPSERQTLGRRIRTEAEGPRVKIDPIPRDTCGTVRGYQVHSEQHERTCTLCRAAWTTYHRDLRAARTEAAS